MRENLRKREKERERERERERELHTFFCFSNLIMSGLDVNEGP